MKYKTNLKMGIKVKRSLQTKLLEETSLLNVEQKMVGQKHEMLNPK